MPYVRHNALKFGDFTVAFFPMIGSLVPSLVYYQDRSTKVTRLTRNGQ